MRSIKQFPLAVLAGALLCSSGLSAQSSKVAARITSEVNEASLTTLKGNVPHLARAEFDQGETEASAQLTEMRLVLSRTKAQQAALDSYLVQLQDKSSPNYHKWLTPQQFGQLYGPADADIAALQSWLESYGFKVETVSAGRTSIAFSGSVGQVEEAFHTSIHTFQANGGENGGKQFYSNTTDPRIPSALAPVVMGVAHLNTIQPRPHSVQGRPGRINPQTKRLEALSASEEAAAAPNLTTTNGGDVLWIVPADAATIYNTPNSYNANFSSGTSYTGTGVKIGVGGVATVGTGSIVKTYRSTFLGSSYATLPTIVATGSGLKMDSGDVNEAYIDLELSGAMAPGATIYYYPSANLDSGIETAINANVVDIFSLSWGECEADMGASENALIKGYWEQAATDGIAVTVSTGDTGSASCDGDASTVPTVASLGLSVSGYASTPYNVAVGGTDFYGLESSFSTYVSTSSGSSSTYYRTAKSYIPEAIWNDSVEYDGTQISANVAVTGSGANITAGGGGVSSCATGSGTSCSGYSKPTWQTGTGVPSDGKRDIPDVSVMSGNGIDSATWLICDASYPCSSISGGNFDGYGGTSTAAPAFAGILALVQQSVQASTGCTGTSCRLGASLPSALYTLYNGAHSNAIFHDQSKLGNNSVPCVENSSNCSLTKTGGIGTSADYFESGYNTNASGYDRASGMGSVDATELVNYWSSATSSSVTFSLAAGAAAPSSVSPGASATSVITVTAVNGYAGTVTLTCAQTSTTATGGVGASCSIPSTAVAMGGTATATVITTAATSARLSPEPGGRGRGLIGAGGGAVLACLIFFGIPARRRGWRSMLGVLAILAALGSLSACGSGGSTSTGNSGTTAGTYTFTVSGTGNPTVMPTPATTFTVTVN